MKAKKIIIALSIVLVILLILFSIVSRFNRRADQNSNQNLPNLVPTVEITGGATNPISTPLGQESEARALKALSIEQGENFQTLRSRLPLSFADFDIDYSPVVDKYFISKKTPEADSAIDRFLKQNNLFELKSNFPELFVITAGSLNTAIEKAEQEYHLKRQEKFRSAPQVQGLQDSDANPLEKLLKTLFDLNSANQTIGTDGTAPPPAGGQFQPGDISSIDAIFSEAGSKVGTPPSLLKSIMQIECGPLLSIPSETVVEYSTPGKGLPEGHLCFFNGVAYGPMQFIPSTWAAYANAVNGIGGYAHESYVQNIRDSAYGAAKKLNNDAGNPPDHLNWTQEQVYAAGRAYYGACQDEYINYCETAWQNYQSNK